MTKITPTQSVYKNIYLSDTAANKSMVRIFFHQTYLNAIYNVKAAVCGKLVKKRCEHKTFEQQLKISKRVKLLASAFILSVPLVNIFALAMLRKLNQKGNGGKSVSNEPLIIHPKEMSQKIDTLNSPLDCVKAVIAIDYDKVSSIDQLKTILIGHAQKLKESVINIQLESKSTTAILTTEFVKLESEERNAPKDTQRLQSQTALLKLEILCIELEACHIRQSYACENFGKSFQGERVDVDQDLKEIKEINDLFCAKLSALKRFKEEYVMRNQDDPVLGVSKKVFLRHQEVNSIYQAIGSAINLSSAIL